jgi:hypothetical protein
MANADLALALDYILNRCDENSIEVISAAVVRRRRDLAMFGGATNIPDPQRMARELSGKINIGSSIEGLKQSVRDMTVRIIRQEAPELNDEQIEELTRAWIPGEEGSSGGGGGGGSGSKLPPDLLGSMIDQFVSFSRGTMSKAEDKKLRDEMGSWPERYWKAFPQVMKSFITDYLKVKITADEFNSKIGIALAMD